MSYYIIIVISFFALLILSVIFIPPSFGPGVVFGLIIVFAVLLFGEEKLFKPWEREVEIVKKRITKRDMRDYENDSNSHVLTNITVDYRIVGKRFVHTASCPWDVFRYLKEGKTYTVGVFFSEIRYVKK